MRYKKWTSAYLLNEALESPTMKAEVTVNGETIAVSAVTELETFGVTWKRNGVLVTEEDAAEVLARWAVEGV
jgi:hypothetical protein